MDSWSNHETFPMDTGIDTRVGVTGPVVNTMIADFYNGVLKDGVQVFQEVLLSKMNAAGLSDNDEWYQVDVVGVHPDNREKTGLVSVDAHDLVLRMHRDGFRMSLVDCVACQIPPTAEGEKWRQTNEKLALESDGLLPPYQGSFLQIVTSRGSHTTAGIRIVKFGARAVHDDLALDGKVSSSKICEQRSSPLH